MTWTAECCVLNRARLFARNGSRVGESDVCHESRRQLRLQIGQQTRRQSAEYTILAPRLQSCQERRSPSDMQANHGYVRYALMDGRLPSSCALAMRDESYCPVSKLHSAPPPAFCMISFGSSVQRSLETLSMLEPAAPSEGMPAAAAVAKISLVLRARAACVCASRRSGRSCAA
jgi:hypothetical protein